MTTAKQIHKPEDFPPGNIINDPFYYDKELTERISSIHEAQLLTYLRLAKIKTGLIIIKHGIKRLPYSFTIQCGVGFLGRKFLPFSVPPCLRGLIL